jgi:outer membrane lipoprotein carrier protein
MLEMTCKLRLVGLSLFLVMAGAHAEQDIDAGDIDEKGRALVADFVENVKTMSGRFDQSLVDADDEVVEESSGILSIERPGRFRWVYQKPYEQMLVADGLNVWSYDADLAQVTVKPQSDVLGGTPAALLGGSAGALEGFEYVASTLDRGTTWVELRPLAAEGSFTKVELGFTDEQLSRMIFSDNLGQSTLVALFDLKINEWIDSSQFEFSPPPGVDLVGSPLLSDATEQ